RKYDRILDDVAAGPDDHLLEIGCGWGGFAEHAAKTRGCRVTALTISPAQHAYASERLQREGLNERVDLRLQDYRDVEAHAFDKAASIEMFEAVGERHWPTFFDKLRAALKPGGSASLQIITIADDLFQDYRNSADYIQKYVFPGGMLPSRQKLGECFGAASLDLKDAKFFGQDYARTVSAWNEAFQNAWPRIRGMGFDERFRRMWSFYLAYCEGGFAAGSIDVGRFVVRRA
ncbi:MAG: cyclopropane-fatty-acyl-phospholipid synthase family protein, partial [Pseudomonadota bacterium]